MNKKEFGKRLRIFIKERFGTYAKGAEAFSMKPASFQTYLNGDSLPGSEIISKLVELGCDMEWLFDVKVEETITANQCSEESKTYTVKDKIIISQAEEIFLLKKQLLDLTEKLDKLENETGDLLVKVELDDYKRRKESKHQK